MNFKVKSMQMSKIGHKNTTPHHKNTTEWQKFKIQEWRVMLVGQKGPGTEFQDMLLLLPSASIRPKS